MRSHWTASAALVLISAIPFALVAPGLIASERAARHHHAHRPAVVRRVIEHPVRRRGAAPERPQRLPWVGVFARTRLMSTAPTPAAVPKRLAGIGALAPLASAPFGPAPSRLPAASRPRPPAGPASGDPHHPSPVS
jgi:hypothetical protein